MYMLCANSLFKTNRGRGKMKKVTILSVFAFMTLLSTASIGFALYSSATPWPMYRYDVAHSGSTPSDVPNNNNTLWVYSAGASGVGPRSIDATPLIVDGRVIFEVTNRVFAVVETTGVQLWGYQATGWLTAPTYADGKVFLGIMTNAGGLVCLNASTGQEIWKQDLSPSFVMGSPLVSDGMVYVGLTGNKTVAFDVSGGYKWEYKTDGPVYSSPAADGDLLFFGSDDTKLYALNVSGSTPVSLWNFTANGAIRSSSAVAGGMVFFGSDNHTLYALNEATGELVWSWATTNAAKFRNSVSVANNCVFLTSTDAGKIYALRADVAPGNYTETDLAIRNWTKEVPGVGGWLEPVYAGGKIVVTSTASSFYVLDANTGTTLWDRESNWYPGYGPAIVADGRLWFSMFWSDPSYTLNLFCIGSPFPPTTSLYRVNAGGSSFDVALETNSTVTNFNTTALETQRKIGFNVQGIGANDMCNITLPDAMLSGPFNVTVDGEQPVYMAEPASNGTHTSLYFTYNGTIPQTIEITGTNVISEFPTIAILPILITTLFVTIVQLKRKRNK
jgi:outer membrane protein assembly factor BamB